MGNQSRYDQIVRAFVQVDTRDPIAASKSPEMVVARNLDAALTRDLKPVVDQWSEGLINSQELVESIMTIAFAPAD
jgi:hypothetical protein